MPIYNNNYVAPVWINDMPPAIDEDEMRAMSQTIQASQVLVGTGAPTQYTTGVVGQRYADTSTTPNTIYKLVTAAEDANVWALDESAGNLALDYDPTATYAAGDYCIYGGALYRANADIAQPEAWTAANWTRAYLADDLAEHVSDTNNPHEVTAQQAGAISKTPDYSFHKDSGWYRFLTINISSGRSNSILLLVQDTYSDGGTSIPYKAMISLYITRQSSGSFYSSANLLTGVGFTKDGFYYTYDSSSGNVSIYVFKKTDTNGYIGVTVISSLNRAASYVDLSDSFESTAITTLPEGGWYFQAMQDGAGNVIPDTYATKAEVSELDAEDVGAVPNAELDGATATASGAVASFETASAQVLPTVVVDVEPVQAGSGDPSPDNVRPISGWSECKVTRTGKNLFDLREFAETYPQYCTYDESTGELFIQSNAVLYDQGIEVSLPLDELNGGDFQLEACNVSGTNFSVRIVYADGNIIDTAGTETETDFITIGGTLNSKKVTSVRFNWTNPGTFIVRNFIISGGTAFVDYEPYSGNKYTIQLGQTVYGGTLDVTNGVLTVDRAMVDLGSLTWTSVSSNRFRAAVSDIPLLADNNTYPNAICSMFSGATPNNYINYDGVFHFSSTIHAVYIRDTSYSDETAFKSAVSGQRLVYELATPITIPLTPTEISALKGENNVWADTGDVTVTYRTGQVALLSDVAVVAEGAQAQTEALEAAMDASLSELEADKANASVIAPVEASSTASTNYAVGDHLMLYGVLYEVTVAISSGETITPGTNVSATTVTGITDGLDTRTTALETALDGLVSQLAQM